MSTDQQNGRIFANRDARVSEGDPGVVIVVTAGPEPIEALPAPGQGKRYVIHAIDEPTDGVKVIRYTIEEIER